MELGDWNILPSVALLEIFSYLSHDDRIQASSSCKHWRRALFHPGFWKDIHFKAKSSDGESVSRTQFLLTHCFAMKLRNATVTFDSMDSLCVKESANILNVICNNNQLRGLILKPSHGRFECPGRSHRRDEFYEGKVVKPLKLLVTNSHQLERLNMGCSEHLSMSALGMINLISQHQARSLRHLGLATVKDDPNNYELLDLDPSLIRKFHRLQMLSLDYDYITNGLLASLRGVGMKRLVVHVHGIDDSHPGTSDSAWFDFKKHNPECELRLTLIHSYDAVNVLDTRVLKPCMPLTHFKAFFCEQMNVVALHTMYQWYNHTLTSLWWVDSTDSSVSNILLGPEANEVPDPLVMAAWRCTRLHEIVLLGYKYCDEDLIAIARLMRTRLKRLEIAERDVIQEIYPCPLDGLKNDVSDSLGKPWAPLQDSQLHDVILNPIRGDSDEYILPILMQDQLS